MSAAGSRDAGGSWAERAYAALLRCYPGPFREEYGGEMSAAFAGRWEEVRRTGGALAAGRLALSVGADTLATALGEHRHLLAQDLRHAWRALFRSRNLSFTLASGATLALGIGGATTIFSLVHAVLLAPLPYRQPERVVFLAETNLPRGIDDFAVSYPNFLSWEEQARSFTALAGLREVGVNLSGERGAERLDGLAVSADLFEVLGLPLVAGRAFSAAEDRPGGAAVAILSERLWRRRFGGDRSLLGRPVRIEGAPHTVVGIAPQDVGFSTDIDVWLPLKPDPGVYWRGDRRLLVLGRLAPGVTPERATAEMESIAAALAREFPDSNEGWGALVKPARDWIVDPDLRARLLVLLAAVGVLLLVACANVANLQLARATARTREIGVRRALGASPARVVRHLMAESLVLAALGGALGLGLAWAAVEGAAAVLPVSMPRLATLELSWPVAAAGLVITGLTAVAFGLLPALLAGGADLQGALQQGGRSSLDAARTPVREALVVTQLALATMLVVAAALLVQSFVRLQSVALGFQPDQLVTARISFPDWGDEESHPEDHVLLDALLAEVRSLPGVVSAGMSSEIPLGEVDTTMAAAAQRVAPGGEEGVQVSWRTVTPDYLSTLGIPLRRGRWLQSGEHHRSALVSEALARRVWPDGADPVGRQVWLSNGQAYNVVGLVGDSRQLSLAEGITPTIYMSSTWVILPTMNLLVRTAGDPDALAGELRQVSARLSPDRPFFDVRTMSAVIAGSVAEPRLQTVVVALFAGVGLLLAAVGAAGVVAYGVVQRTPELAVRGALGASPGRLLRHVLRRGVVLCGAGVALGLLLAFALGAALQDLLYGVRADAPATYAAAALTLLAAGTIACWLPARRATRINPNLALRAE